VKIRLLSLVGVCTLSLLASCAKGEKSLEIPARAEATVHSLKQVELTSDQEASIGLQVATVVEQSLPITVTATGQVQAAQDRLAHVTTPAAGSVTDIFCRLGETVTAGQALASVKSDTVGQIESDLLQATLQNASDLQQAQLQLNLSHATYQREQKLFHDRISAKADLEAARTQFEKDRGTLQAVQLKQQATIRTAQQRLSLYGVAEGAAERVVQDRRIDPYITIAAPRSGVLVSRAINIGELSDPSKDMFGIADLSQVWAVANIYEKDVAKVKVGQAVRLTLDSLSTQPFEGSISYVADQLDPQSRTLVIRAIVPNPGFKLKPNMFAHIDVLTQNHLALVAPHTALQRLGNQTYAYVAVGSHRYEERLVEVANDNGRFVQIIHGLTSGEKVVTHGTLELQGKALILHSSATTSFVTALFGLLYGYV